MTKQLLLTTILSLLSAGHFNLQAESNRTPAQQQGGELTVRIYDYAGLPGDLLIEAAEAARAIYLRSGVPTRWIQCPTPTNPNPADLAMFDPSCDGPVGPHVIQMRIMATVPPTLSELNRFVYGFALPSKTGGFGTAATVFLDRVTRSAELSKVNETDLLACVMAHEAGHLLLGANSHSNYGLMSAAWKKAEFTKIAEGAFNFFGREKKRIANDAQARLTIAAKR